jgi:outer membrane protein insertion porin family
VRLQRLSYFEQVEIETPAVPGTDDQVDIIVSVLERPAGSFTVGLGFSQVQGLIFSLSVQQENFLGSGKRLGLGVSHSSIISSLNISYDNPYWTDDGISRGFYARYQEFDQGQANISTFTSSEWALGVNFGAPITEVDYLRSGGGFRHSSLNIGTFACVDPLNPVPGEPCLEVGLRPSPADPLSHALDLDQNGVISDSEREFNVLDWTISWTRDSRNHFLNPSRGSAQSLSLQTALPGSSRQYYKLMYRGAKYWPIWGGLVFSVRGNLGYGDSYDSYDKDLLANAAEMGVFPGVDPEQFPQPIGDCDPTDAVRLDTGLPFYEHFYSGGVRDLRGYDDNTLGPKDYFCRSVGGDFKVAGGVELAIPTPFVGSQSGTRIALFVDTGYVYENISAFEADKLRGSFGLSVTWEAPIGPIVISYAFPFNDRPGDRTEDLQFSFGTTF